jgi:DNA polymerase III subunit alpha
MLLARSYSHHSLLSAIPQINTLVLDAKEKGYTSIALTDEDSCSGLIEFYDACKKNEVGFCPGSTLRIKNIGTGDAQFNRSKEFSKVAILCQSNKGYKNMLELVSKARTVREEPKYHLIVEDFKGRDDIFVNITSEHEIIASILNDRLGAAQGILDEYLKNINKSQILIELYFPTFQIPATETKILNLKLIDFCKKNEIKYVISPAPRYCSKEDEEVFRAILAVRGGLKIDEIKVERDFALPSVDTLKQIYDYCPECFDTESIENTIKVEIRTDYDKHANEAFFPIYDLPQGQDAKLVLTRQVYLGLVSRFADTKESYQDLSNRFPYEKLQDLKDFAVNITPNTDSLMGYSKEHWQNKTIADYIERIEMELDVIITKGFSAYFLVFADLMDFCQKENIVTNTRGSAAGCLVGYLTGISILDPLVYDIPFERFLNPLRPSAPDIDGDFADDKRDRVIQYITEKYGANKVCQIITFGTMQPRAAVRDIGRVLSIGYTKCDRLSKIIPTPPQGRKATFKWALETSQELAEAYEKDADTKRIIDLAKRVEGNYRHASVHAAGVIISPTELTDFVPLQWDSDHKMIIAQYDMKVTEKIGLVKMDILGISNLAILGNAVELSQQRHDIKVDLRNIDLYDPKAYDLLSKGRTLGLFQLSGPAMTRFLVQLQPSRVQDLMAMVALYRPGPMANLPDYIKRKNNPKLTKYYVPQMEKWMKDSYGILVYQDDLLYSVIELAGYDWAEADTFRKGVGKKVQAILETQHKRFVDGCLSHSKIPNETAEAIWDLFVPFAAYGFNKAHAASYGMIAYWTAYMKAEFPAEFMTSLMTSESNNLDKVGLSIVECQEMGIDVLPPDINESFLGFHVINDKASRYGLASVKNLGSDVIKFMIEERRKSGNYKNLEDFLERISQFQGFNKRGLEALIISGAMDGLKVV